MFLRVIPLTFSLIFFIETVMGIALSSNKNIGVDICTDMNLCDSEYASNVLRLRKDSSNFQVFLDRLNDSAVTFKAHFAPSRRKKLLKDWVGQK